jgi:aromatic-L-amino-acid decarboxylase
MGEWTWLLLQSSAPAPPKLSPKITGGSRFERYTEMMPPEEFRRYGHEVVDWLAGYMTRIRDYPVLAQVSPGGLARSLPESAPEEGESMDTILAGFRDQVMPAVTQWNHPRFHAYFAVSGSPPGILAELLAAGLNQNGMLWKSSPAATELEMVTLGWLRQWIGLPEDFFGMIHDTASIGVMHAMAAAREHAGSPLPDLVLYCTPHAHSSIEKAAATLGLDAAQVRKVAMDDAFRMIPGELERAVQQDIVAGRRPFCAVATVGTTPVAAIDPVPAIADVCERHAMWLHVDGAYGGCAAIVPEMRHVLEGARRAQSVIVNPHKWLLTPIDLSVLYTQRPELLRQAFRLVPDYLRTADDPAAVNLMDYGLPLGRRFRSLKLWFVMRYYGRSGLAGVIRGHCEAARELAGWIESDARFELAAPVSLSLVCFRLRSSDAENQRLLDRVNEDGFAFLSATTLNGRFALRFAIGNWQTTIGDVRASWRRIADLAY